MKVHITARAEADLRRLGEYIARDSLAQAEEFLHKLRGFIFNIGDYPLRHRTRPEWGGEVRAANFGSYLIIYEVQSDIVLVLRVASGRRNIAALLSEV